MAAVHEAVAQAWECYGHMACVERAKVRRDGAPQHHAAHWYTTAEARVP